MTFRVKIVSPIRVDQADLERRQRRYTECAKSSTHVQVLNLHEGPTALNSVGDLFFCEYRVFEEGRQTNANDFDAILVDCVFDPAVDALHEHTGASRVWTNAYYSFAGPAGRPELCNHLPCQEAV